MRAGRREWTMQNIDVEKIMEEIRQDIAEKGYKEEDLDFTDIAVDAGRTGCGSEFDENELAGQAAYLNSHYNNPIYFPLKGNPVKVFFQKAVRRMLLFVIFPGFQFQNKFNVATVRCMNQFKHYVDENEALAKQVKAQQEELEECKKQLAALQKEMNDRFGA